MKRNIDEFNGMKDFIIGIVTVIAWVLIGAIVIIGFFTINTKGESVILAYISTIFTIISSLGIVATVGVYFLQKINNERLDEENLKKKKKSISLIFRMEIDKLIAIHEDILLLLKTIKDYKSNNSDLLRMSFKNEFVKFEFISSKEKDVVYEILTKKIDLDGIKDIMIASVDTEEIHEMICTSYKKSIILDSIYNTLYLITISPQQLIEDNIYMFYRHQLVSTFIDSYQDNINAEIGISNGLETLHNIRKLLPL